MTCKICFAVVTPEIKTIIKFFYNKLIQKVGEVNTPTFCNRFKTRHSS